MKRVCFFALLLAWVLAPALACKDTATKVVKTAPITFKKEGELSVFRKGTDSLLARLDIEIADTDYETQTGLMYRNTMEKGQGMLFVFPEEAMHSFYMKNTKIPLDLIFIRADKKVGSITENAQPLDEKGLSSVVPVQYVLEVNAGLAAQWGLQRGDSIAYRKD